MVADTRLIDRFATEQMCQDARTALEGFESTPSLPSTGPVINNISVCIKRK